MGDYIEDFAILQSTCFTCTRLNSTTFRIVEDDRYHEYPFIYVKITPHALAIIDTGCGGATEDTTIELTSLRKFIETYPIAENANAPLNPNGEKDYVIICTHCHYDHILGIEDFSLVNDWKTSIWASSYDKSFLSKENLPTHSLCNFLHPPVLTPKYSITHWAKDGAPVTHRYEGDDVNLGLVTYHTPGHTPDELAIWNSHERVLFVGDSLYEWAPIIFPKEGDLITYSESMGKLRDLVSSWNSSGNTEYGPEEETTRRVTAAAGHCTFDTDAEELLRHVDAFLWDVITGKEQVKRKEIERGEVRWLFEQEGGRLSLLVPARLVEDFRKDERATRSLRKRVKHGEY